MHKNGMSYFEPVYPFATSHKAILQEIPLLETVIIPIEKHHQQLYDSEYDALLPPPTLKK